MTIDSITLGSPAFMGALVGRAIAWTMASRSPESIDGREDIPAVDGVRGDISLGMVVKHPVWLEHTEWSAGATRID